VQRAAVVRHQDGGQDGEPAAADAVHRPVQPVRDRAEDREVDRFHVIDAGALLAGEEALEQDLVFLEGPATTVRILLTGQDLVPGEVIFIISIFVK
jgi:hypothetical protein